MVFFSTHVSGTQRSPCILRADTREVHNKLEKNRRAHLKDCFEQLKKELPYQDEKKTSNLSILGNAFRTVQVSDETRRSVESDGLTTYFFLCQYI